MRALLSLLRRPLGTALVLALSAACGADDPAGDASGDTSGSGEDATGDSGCDLAVAPVADAPCACVGDQWEGERDGCDQICFCTNRGWQCRADGCVDATGDEGDSPTSSAALSWQGPVTVREVTGNGDGKAQPGEAWEVVTRLASDVEAPGVDTVVRIESISPRVRIDEASSPYAGVSATGVDVAMPFRIADDASAGVASIELSAFVPGGFSTISETVEVTIEQVAAPRLLWSGCALAPAPGADDERVEAGESWSASCRLANEGTVATVSLALSASASSGTLELGELAGAPASLIPGASSTVTVPFTVAASPLEARPTIALVALADGIEPAGQLVEVPLELPDTLSVTSYAFSEATAGDGAPTVGETWRLEVNVANTGAFEVDGLRWELRPTDVVAFEFAAPSGPGSIAAGGSARVTAELVVTETTPPAARMLLRPSSSVRTIHGPFPLDLAFATR
jgi:hypothetical protein